MSEFTATDGGVTEPLFDGLNEDNLEDALLDAAVEVEVTVKPKRTRKKAAEPEPVAVAPKPEVEDVIALMMEGLAPAGHFTDLVRGELPNQLYVTCTPLVTDENGDEVPNPEQGSYAFTFFVREV